MSKILQISLTMSRHLVLCYAFVLPIIYKIELYLGKVASLAVFLWA